MDMKADMYMRAVITTVAVSLIWICVRDVSVVPEAHGQFGDPYENSIFAQEEQRYAAEEQQRAAKNEALMKYNQGHQDGQQAVMDNFDVIPNALEPYDWHAPDAPPMIVFYLRSHETGKVYGPFEFAHGKTIRIHKTTFTIQDKKTSLQMMKNQQRLNAPSQKLRARSGGLYDSRGDRVRRLGQ